MDFIQLTGYAGQKYEEGFVPIQTSPASQHLLQGIRCTCQTDCTMQFEVLIMQEKLKSKCTSACSNCKGMAA